MSLSRYFVRMISGLAVVSMVGCASKSKQEAERHETKAATPPTTAAAQSSVEAKAVAYEQQAAYVTELSFGKGSNKLTSAGREKLTKLLKDAKIAGNLTELKIVSWADMEYPSDNTKKLSKSERDLATSRGNAIKTYLKKQDKNVKVTNYNMAERPNVFENWLNTSDARIKKSLEASGIPNTDTSVKVPAKASKSMVMAILKQ